jgi:hypothetical protein
MHPAEVGSARTMRSGKRPHFGHPASAGTGTDSRRPRALVVFEDRPGPPILRLLRPGFRHCFCVVGSDRAWTICDPLKTRIEIVPLLGFGESQLAAHYRRTGRVVLAGNVVAGTAPRRACLRPVTCVEVVKRVLNVEAPSVLTPFQLHRALVGAAFGTEPFLPFELEGDVTDGVDSVDL